MSDDQTATKYCLDCNAERPLAEFYRTKDQRYAGGYRYNAYYKTHMMALRSCARQKCTRRQ